MVKLKDINESTSNKIKNILKELHFKGIPLSVWIGEGNVIARGINDFKQAALEITKLSNSIFVEIAYNVSFDNEKPLIFCNDVLDYEIKKNKLIRFSNEDYSQKIFEFAEKENKNVVVLESKSLFDYDIKIF